MSHPYTVLFNLWWLFILSLCETSPPTVQTRCHVASVLCFCTVVALQIFLVGKLLKCTVKLSLTLKQVHVHGTATQTKPAAKCLLPVVRGSRHVISLIMSMHNTQSMQWSWQHNDVKPTDESIWLMDRTWRPHTKNMSFSCLILYMYLPKPVCQSFSLIMHFTNETDICNGLQNLDNHNKGFCDQCCTLCHIQWKIFDYFCSRCHGNVCGSKGMYSYKCFCMCTFVWVIIFGHSMFFTFSAYMRKTPAAW